jgi:hypothetical protein
MVTIGLGAVVIGPGSDELMRDEEDGAGALEAEEPVALELVSPQPPKPRTRNDAKGNRMILRFIIWFSPLLLHKIF